MVDLDHQMFLITVRQSATTHALLRYVIDLWFCCTISVPIRLQLKKKAISVTDRGGP
jgi:hypothetical protein